LRVLAAAVSAITSPFVVICAFALWVIAYHCGSGARFVTLSVPFLVLIIGLPFVWILLGVRRGRFTDMHVMLREQRFEPFVVATAGAAGLTAVYLALGAPRPLTALAVDLVVNGALFGVISRAWKVSVHAAAYAAGVLTAAVLIDGRLAALFAAMPLVVWARVIRKRHDVPQSIAAAGIAIITTWGVFWAMGVP
jgi:hypothetical protein